MTRREKASPGDQYFAEHRRKPGLQKTNPNNARAARPAEHVCAKQLRIWRLSAVGRWNRAMREFLFQRGLLAKDEETFYFPPNSDGTARSLTWESTRGRWPERQVAYPYIGKKSGLVAFWVHHP